jgi:hypothetical protein
MVVAAAIPAAIAIIATRKYIRPVEFDTAAQLTLRLACVLGVAQLRAIFYSSRASSSPGLTRNHRKQERYLIEN